MGAIEGDTSTLDYSSYEYSSIWGYYGTQDRVRLYPPLDA